MAKIGAMKANSTPSCQKSILPSECMQPRASTPYMTRIDHGAFVARLCSSISFGGAVGGEYGFGLSSIIFPKLPPISPLFKPPAAWLQHQYSSSTTQKAGPQPRRPSHAAPLTATITHPLRTMGTNELLSSHWLLLGASSCGVGQLI